MIVFLTASSLGVLNTNVALRGFVRVARFGWFCSYKQTNKQMHICANKILTSVVILNVVCFALPHRCLDCHPLVNSAQDSPRLPASTV